MPRTAKSEVESKVSDEEYQMTRVGRPEWELRSERNLVNVRCACGAVPETGLICNACRRSNEPDED